MYTIKCIELVLGTNVVGNNKPKLSSMCSKIIAHHLQNTNANIVDGSMDLEVKPEHLFCDTTTVGRILVEGKLPFRIPLLYRSPILFRHYDAPQHRRLH